ncbi:MAG: dihydrodipicolinate synthase family protein [Rhizobiaceae bacterium]
MLQLPTIDGRIETYKLTGTPLVPRPPRVEFTRTAFAAAHVVSDPLEDATPWQGRPAIDWEQTLNIRSKLWDQGFDIAEAMDTAQRSMGVDWLTAKELIERTTAAARTHPARPRVACGAGTDHLDTNSRSDIDAIIKAYETQMEAIEAADGQIILMASRAFGQIGASAEDYANVYHRLIDQAAEPVILHWLGSMFDPALGGYWGSDDLEVSSKAVLDIIATNPDKVDGIKVSLLEQVHEERLRERLPDGVRLYTGDDFNYAKLIAGDGDRFSHALLGIFTAIAPAAAQALEALSEDNLETYHRLLSPTVALSREIFRSPTRYYKAGIALLSWVNGLQSHFIMPAGFQASRSITHFAQVFRLADQAGLLADPDLAKKRMRSLLATFGIE